MTRAETFSAQVARVYATRLVQFGCTVAVAFLLARLLGPEGRGVYALLLLLPTTLFALGQLGLPSAITYFAGGGRSLGSLAAAAAGLGAVLAGGLLLLSLVALPSLRPVLFAGAPLDLLRVAVLALPVQMTATFFGSMLWGRQLVRPYSRVLAVQSVAWLLAVIGVVGIADLGVAGALASYLVVTAGGAATVVALVLRQRAVEGEGRRTVRIGDLLGYGLRLYPAGIATFLSYRADLFLLSALTGDAGAIGLYAMAVSLAEITFQVPDSVATLFYPRVAGSARADADRMAPGMARISLLVTIVAALALLPVAWLAVHVLLPAFDGSLLPFVILLPGTVALGLSKVLSGYISGLGMPGPVSAIAAVALGVNLVANLVLIPPLGIVGAALSSVLSYGTHAALTIRLASRLSGAPFGGFLRPGRAELRGLRDRLAGLRRGRSTPG
ncbi:MAG TPA: polysaccharide biosynthesis C-terminal domain-containing protein [Candidatus Limnocylindria bacterium]